MPVTRIAILMGWLLFLAACATPPPASLQLSGLPMVFKRPADPVIDMAMSADGHRLVTITGQKTPGLRPTLHLWDLSLGRHLRAIPINSLQSLTAVAISPDGRQALVGGTALPGGSSLELWNLDRGQRIHTFSSLDKELVSVAFSPQKDMVMAGHGTYIYLFNAGSGEFLRQFDTGHYPALPGVDKRVHAVFTPDGHYIVSGGPDAVLKMWDVESTQKVQHWAGHQRSLQGGITGIAVSSDSRFILTSAAGDEMVRRWDIAEGKQLAAYAGHDALWKGVWATALSRDDRYGLTVSDSPSLWDLESGQRLWRLAIQGQGFSPEKNGYGIPALFSASGKTLLVRNGGGGVKLYDTLSGRERATLTTFDDGEWLAITADGYFNASVKGAEHLTLTVDGKPLSLERLYDPFFRPDIVIAALQGEETRNIAPLNLVEAVKSPPPTVRFTNTPANTDTSTAKICYEVSGNGGIGEIRLYHNGKLIVSDGYYRDMVKTPKSNLPLMAMSGSAIHERMRQVWNNTTGNPMPLVSHEKGTVFSDCKEIDPVAGDNEISISAFNKGNTLQSPATTLRFTSAKAPPPHLYILAIGINKYKERAVNLRFSAKDATDFQAALGKQAGSIFSTPAVHAETLVNEKAGKAAILKRINELSTIVNPHDSFVLFFAGHGVLLQDQYYLLTHDYNGTLTEDNTLSSNELVDVSKKIKALRQFYLIDSCHAGGIDEIVGSLYEARMGVLAKKMGVHLLTAAESVQEALDGYEKNGLLTHDLLQSLKAGRGSSGNQAIGVEALTTLTLENSTARAERSTGAKTPIFFRHGRDFPLYLAP